MKKDCSFSYVIFILKGRDPLVMSYFDDFGNDISKYIKKNKKYIDILFSI
jgi:hypothetical protein